MTTPEVRQTGSEYSIQERLASAVERLADVAERIDAKLTTAAEVEYARIGDTVIKDTEARS
jgi:hypothetical protein